jgi:hypothetical protein
MGWIFKDEVNEVLLILGNVGKAGILLVLAVLAFVARWLRGGYLSVTFMQTVLPPTSFVD